MATKNDARAQREARARLRAYEERQHNHSTKISRRKTDNVVISVVAILAVLIAVGSQITFTLNNQGSQASASASPVAGVPDKAQAENRQWTGAMSLAGVPLGFTLDGAAAPQAVASTVSLIKAGFYTGITCHRLTTEGIYVLQCGDPQGTGAGGPGYSYGPVENAPANNVYPAGTIAMARQSGNGSSMGSQFFIVYKDSTIPSDSAGGYTVVGNITTGLPQLITDVTSHGTSSNTGDGPPIVSALIQSISVK
jgi:peptidyl-prolyl cis-trans isomerase B (cyclophilin B)